MPKAKTNTMNEGAEKLFNNPKFSDLTIRCGFRSWPAHKVVLCTQSEYIDRIDGHEGIIDLREDDPKVIAFVLEWSYHTDKNHLFTEPSYDGSLPLNQSPEDLARLYEAADKYLLLGLKNDVEGYFDDSIFKSDTFHATIKAIQHIYDMDEDVSEPLRAILLNDVVSRRKALCGVDEVLAGGFRQLLLTAPREFVADVTTKLGNRK